MSARAPKHIREWLAAEETYLGRPLPKSFAGMLRCPQCQKWFRDIDHLAPYHWENCYCAHCKLFLHQMPKFVSL